MAQWCKAPTWTWFMCVFYQPWGRQFLLIAKSSGDLDCSEGGSLLTNEDSTANALQSHLDHLYPFVSICQLLHTLSLFSIYIRNLSKVSTKLCNKTQEVSIVKNRMTSTFAAGWFDMIWFLWIHLGPTPRTHDRLRGQILRILWCKLTTLNSELVWNQFPVWVNQILATVKHWNNFGIPKRDHHTKSNDFSGFCMEHLSFLVTTESSFPDPTNGKRLGQCYLQAALVSAMK